MTGLVENRRGSLLEWLCLSALITLSFLGVPYWAWRLIHRSVPRFMQTHDWWNWQYHLLSLAFALLLTAGSCRRSGVRVGNIRPHWWKVLIVCGLPIAITAAVYPHLPERPFAREHIAIWLISPLAQDLVFVGYIYGRLEPLLPGYLHRRVRVRWAIVVTAAFFAAHHLPNLQAWSAGFVAFQLGYTFLGCTVIGLSRQWTGSVLYITLSHTAVNCIAWAID